VRHQPHWYKQYVYECPVCGSGKIYRERVYGKKPKKYTLCYEYKQNYDNCLGF
jgi:predicted RNA-binding Zn-ribbon protein involved in translation (DUF1610 family)